MKKIIAVIINAIKSLFAKKHSNQKPTFTVTPIKRVDSTSLYYIDKAQQKRDRRAARNLALVASGGMMAVSKKPVSAFISSSVDDCSWSGATAAAACG